MFYIFCLNSVTIEETQPTKIINFWLEIRNEHFKQKK